MTRKLPNLPAEPRDMPLRILFRKVDDQGRCSDLVFRQILARCYGASVRRLHRMAVADRAKDAAHG
jgi:hypothetical protein